MTIDFLTDIPLYDLKLRSPKWELIGIRVEKMGHT